MCSILRFLGNGQYIAHMVIAFPATGAGPTTARITAWTLLIHATNGQRLLPCEARHLPTAATTALAER